MPESKIIDQRMLAGAGARLACPVAHVDPLERDVPPQRWLGTTFRQTSDGLVDQRIVGSQELTLQRRIELDLGQVGYLIRTIDRTGSRFVTGLVRASEEFPTPDVVDLHDADTNLMLEAMALQITGDGKYDSPKAQFHVPFERGRGTGVYPIMDTMHTAFMQETAFLFRSAQEQGLFYIRGVEDVAERDRIESMLHGGIFTRVLEQVPGTQEHQEYILGIVPDGHPNAGETVRAEIWPLTETEVAMQTDEKYHTTDGLEHSVVVARKSKTQPIAASPVGWIAAIDSAGQVNIAGQKTTVQLFALEHERVHGYKTLPQDEIQQLVDLEMGNALVPLPEPKRPGCPVVELVEPSDNSLVNLTITWVTLSRILREFTDKLGYDPSTTYLDTFARMQESFQRRHVNTVLTGHLAVQMLEALYPNIPDAFPDIQSNFTSGEEMQPHYERILNNSALPQEAMPIWYHIANFFELENAQGEPVSNTEGQFAYPKFDDDGRVASTLLATGVIALEQMLVAGLIPGSIRYGTDSPFGQDLQNIANGIDDPTFVNDVQSVATQMITANPNVKFGRQRRESGLLVDLVRERTGLATIIEIIRTGDYDRFRNDPRAQQALAKMSTMGQVIQESKFASHTLRQGRGINAGLDAIRNNYAETILETV